MHRVSLGCVAMAAVASIACAEGERAVSSGSGGSHASSRATGGSTATGDGSGGGTTAATSDGSGGATPGDIRECGVVPINPNATQPAKNLLCYLYELHGNNVLSGQQETSWANDPADDVNWIFQQTGKYPAVLGGDYLYPGGTTQRAKVWWNAGGIVMIRYHMGAPPASDTYEDSKGSADIDAVLTPGTAENDSFNSKIAYASRELKVLQNAGVPVLWAPLHEAQPTGWFWWSKGTGAQYVALWKYMYDYMTNTAGLNNLIWVMPFSGSPNAAFYPGKEFVDLAGPDTYDKKNSPFASLYASSTRIIGTTMPIPLHETGAVPNPDFMFPTAAPWVLFGIWAGYEKNTEFNTPSSIQAAYANAYTITRDEVPNLN